VGIRYGLMRHYHAARFLAFAETGHAPNWERPEALAEILNGFWDEIEHGGLTE
jgi:pimeloyl-ACP methyl ester carboxylesterase